MRIILYLIVAMFMILAQLGTTIASDVHPMVKIMYHQTNCQGLYTKVYWYTGRVYMGHSGFPGIKGMIVADQSNVDEYVAIDTPASNLPKYDDIPAGIYEFVIGGYVMVAFFWSDFAVVWPHQRIASLP